VPGGRELTFLIRVLGSLPAGLSHQRRHIRIEKLAVGVDLGRKMLGEQLACRVNAVNDSFRELSLPKQLVHRPGDLFPKRFAAFGMNRLVAQDGEVLRFGRNEYQNCVAMPGLVHAQLHELVRGRVAWVMNLAMAHVHTDLPRRVLLRRRNGRGDPVVVQFVKQMFRLHRLTSFPRRHRRQNSRRLPRNHHHPKIHRLPKIRRRQRRTRHHRPTCYPIHS